MHQCFQLQNLLCDCNKLRKHKWFNIATIIILTLLHTSINTFMHIQKITYTNKSRDYIYINAHVQNIIYWEG